MIWRIAAADNRDLAVAFFHSFQPCLEPLEMHRRIVAAYADNFVSKFHLTVVLHSTVRLSGPLIFAATLVYELTNRPPPGTLRKAATRYTPSVSASVYVT